MEGRNGNKNSYRVRNPKLLSRNNKLWKIDQESRLLLRELSYASLITSYVDNVVSDQDKTEALHDALLMQILKSMADVTFSILVDPVAARRSIQIKDFAFENKTTENNFLVQSTVDLFCGIYFDILHLSAESLRNAKDTKHLRISKQRDGSTSGPARKRKREE